jgi:6-phosphogluconolactonase
MKNDSLVSLVSLSFMLLTAACVAPTSAEQDLTDSAEQDLIAGRAGAVFTLSNDPDGNEVIAWRRGADGSLQRAASYSTTGKGSGDGLGSQGALTLSGDRRYLFAVSAGSGELAVFRVRGASLTLVDAIETGGLRPVSVTEHDGLVYVLHAGEGANDVRGFVQRNDGSLAALAGSTHDLSAPTTGPAQVSFSPSGRALIVTEKATNMVDELRVSPFSGRPTSFVAHASSGQTPFGFAINARGQVIVSEAVGGAPGASTVSSYQLDGRSGLALKSASIPDTEGAACWVVLGGDRAFVSNTASGSISTYGVAADGTLALAAARAADTGNGSKPTDMALTTNGKYLYVLESGTHAIGVTRVESDGSLTVLPDVGGLPDAAAGLAAL